MTLTGDRVNNPIDASFSGTTKKSSPCQMKLNLHRKLGIRYQGTYHWCEALSDLIWTNQVWTNVAANLLNGTLIRMSRNQILKKVNYWSFFTLRAVDKKWKAIWTTGLVLLQHLNSYYMRFNVSLAYNIVFTKALTLSTTQSFTLSTSLYCLIHTLYCIDISWPKAQYVSWVTFGLASVSHIYTMRLSFVLSQSLWQWASESIVVGALA